MEWNDSNPSLVWLHFLKGKCLILTGFNKNNFETENCYFLQTQKAQLFSVKSSWRLNSFFSFQRILCTYAVTILKHHFGEFSMTSFVRFGLLVWSAMILWTYHDPVLFAELVTMDCCRVMAPKPQQKTKELVEGGVRIPGWVVSDVSTLSSIFIFCKLQHLVLFLNPSSTMLWAWFKGVKLGASECKNQTDTAKIFDRRVPHPWILD